MADKTLDTKGLACPLPILKTKKVLSRVPKATPRFATDPGSLPDFTAFCESTGNVMLEQRNQGGNLSHRVCSTALNPTRQPCFHPGLPGITDQKFPAGWA